MLAVLDQLAHVRGLSLAAERSHRIHQNRLRQLAREGSRTTVQHLAETAPERRLAMPTAVALELGGTLTGSRQYRAF